jgi:hypothetical protein
MIEDLVLASPATIRSNADRLTHADREASP